MTREYFRLTHAYLDADRVFRERYLTLLTEALPARARVVELGCGDGVPVAQRLSRTARVIGVDRVAPRLHKAQISAPSALFVQADFTTFGLKPRTLDAVVSFYAMIHVPAARFSDLLGRVGGWLRAEGLFAGVIGSHCSAFPAGPPDSVTCLPTPRLLETLSVNGFVVERVDADGRDTSAGSIEFTWFLARKRPS